jgi:hypothetical protein
METVYFVLGMLSIVAFLFVCATVWGMFKITKLLKQSKQQEQDIVQLNQESWNNLIRAREDIDRRLDNMDRYATERTAELSRELEKRMDDVATAACSYTDRRVDKLIDTYFEMKEFKKSNKQMLKG